MTNTAILKVKNIQQRVLFNWEICGQLSDGYWENTKPNGHWQIWSLCECLVSTDGRYGRNFYALRDDYNLVANELLEAVGQRMHKYAVIALALGDGFDDFFKELSPKYDPRNIEYFFDEEFNLIETKQYVHLDSDFVKEMRDAFNALPLESLSVKCKAITYYKMADLKRDLVDLKTIFRTRI